MTRLDKLIQASVPTLITILIALVVYIYTDFKSTTEKQMGNIHQIINKLDDKIETNEKTINDITSRVNVVESQISYYKDLK